MSAEIVNLRRARKSKARTSEAKEAEANRTLFGRTKAEKTKSRAEQALAGAWLDAHRRVPETPRNGNRGNKD